MLIMQANALLLMYARHTKQTDASVLALLDGLSNEAREEDRKSYYKSLSGLARHILDSAIYFHGLFRASLGDGIKALKPVEGLVDQATIDLVQAQGEAGCAQPIALDWYDGKPATVPFYFLAHQLFEHGTHHRGQISQILDEMGLEHDFSGIALECLPPG
jgi:uncharacterized damage-inducible protein DinB